MASAPNPVSPHASVLYMVSITVIGYICYIFYKCSAVSGLSHINVFIAGATIIGLLISHALITHVSKLSQMPAAILARVFELSGAMSRPSAHLRISICSTLSPIFFHCPNSSASVNTSQTSSGKKLSAAACVVITFILYKGAS